MAKYTGSVLFALQSASPKRPSHPKLTDVFSVTSLQESSDIGLQGKQQAEEEVGKYCVRFTLIRATNCVFGVKHWLFLFSLT